MADTKISALTELAVAPATDDLVAVVDVSDTTQAASGTTKKLRMANLKTAVTDGSTTVSAPPTVEFAGADVTNDSGNAKVSVRSVPAYDATNYGADNTGASDSTTDIATLIGLGAGRIYLPYGTYILKNLQVPSNIELIVAAGSTLKLPSSGLSSGNQVFYLGATWGSSTPESNMTVRGEGGPFTIDLTGKVAGNNYHPILIGSAHYFAVRDVIFKNMPDSAGVQMSRGGSAGTEPYPMYGTLERLQTSGAPTGYGCVQVSGGYDLTFRDLLADGGSTLNLQTDGQFAPLQHVVAENIINQGGANALNISPHTTTIQDVRVRAIRGESSTYLVDLSAPGSGHILDIEVDGGYHSGGTNTVHATTDGTSSDWVNQDRIRFKDITSDTPSGTSFLMLPQYEFDNCVALTPGSLGYADGGFGSSIQGTVRIRGGKVYNPGSASNVQGLLTGHLSRLLIYGTEFIDDRGAGAKMTYGVNTWNSASVLAYLSCVRVSGAITARTVAQGGSTISETQAIS